METLLEEKAKRAHLRRTTCRLCDSKDVGVVMHYQSTPIGDHYVPIDQLNRLQKVYPLDLYFCRKCGQLQLLDVVDPQIIYGDYIYETSSSLGLQEHFCSYAQEIITRFDLRKGSLAVDIGCNDGTFLKCLRERGMTVLGIEPARMIAQRLKASGMDVWNTFFNREVARQIKGERGQAAVVSANNVMANIEDLGDFAEGIRELLAPEGIFTFESGYMVDLIRNCVIDNVYHEHLCYFRLNPLVKYFDSHELEIIDLRHSPTKGGSLRGTVQYKGGPGRVSPLLLDRMLWEQSLGYDEEQTYREFAARMESIRRQLLRLLHDLRKRGKTVSGYGASVGVTTLLYYYGLENIVDVLYDDNPKRHGLYSPGYHIPVVSSEEIYRRKPDYILILAWRYAGPIAERHREYLRKGGHFIVPLPAIEVF